MRKQKLILIRGIPGSGKSTIASKLDAVLIEADQFFENRNGEYKFDRRFIRDAHSWCQFEMKRRLLAGNSVVVANTFIKRWEVERYLETANALGLDIDIELLEANGEFRNVHGVPDDVVARMKTQFEKINPKHIGLSCSGVDK